MQMPKEIYNVLKNIQISLDKILISNSKEQLESFLYLMEKRRMEIYDQIRCINSKAEDGSIHIIDYKYRAKLKNNVLHIYIPELPVTITNTSSYAYKQMVLNISAVTKQYKELFYDKFVIVIIKIFQKVQTWDIDNRTVKPIQDGLLYGKVIKDDSLHHCCYMVQGFYSEEAHIEVSVLNAANILKVISNEINPNMAKNNGKILRKLFCHNKR